MKKLLFILPLIILFSCSIQKRKYQKGFYVSNNKSKTHIVKDNSVIQKKEIRSEDLAILQQPLTINEPIAEASLAKSINPAMPKSYLLLFEGNDTCDVITLKNGDEVRARVLEITPVDIKYKKCDLPDGPLYIVKKSDVFMIKYINGVKEVIKSEEVKPDVTKQQTTNNDYKGPKKMNPFSILAIISAILGIWPLSGLGSILALIFARIALRQIAASPNVYKGTDLAKAAKIIAYIMLSLFALVLILVIIGILLTM